MARSGSGSQEAGSAAIIQAEIAQIRCQTCGRRVPRVDTGCPDHRPVPEVDGPGEGAASGNGCPPSIPGFRALRQVGQGGFGVVFEAERGEGERAAIKVARIDKTQAGSRLQKEIRALRDIGSPHVPAVIEAGELAGGVPYVAMTYMKAPTLAIRLVKAQGPMPLEEAAAIGRAVLRTLKGVHERGYVHGDLKPENIFIDEGGQATLIDFGLSTPTRRDAADDLTKPEGAAGTAEYMAPEQCEGRIDIDERADIYAVGVMLFEMLAGRPPFWGPPAVVQQSHRGLRPPRLAALLRVAAAVSDFVMKCLAKDPRDRFDGAESALQALDAVAAEHAAAPVSWLDVPSSGRGSVEPPPISSTRERRRVALVSFESDADTALVHRRLLLLGGQLAHASGPRFVAIYSHQVGDNPARRALRAAHDLIKQDLCERALCDLAPVVVQTRADGSRRFISPLFSRADRFPSAADPRGVFLTHTAALALPRAFGAVLPRRGWVHLGDARDLLQLEFTPDAAPELPPLFGREPLLSELFESAQRAISRRRPCVAGIIGEEGHGKSRIAAEIVNKARADLPGVIVIEALGREPITESIEPILRGVLRSALDLPVDPPIDGGRALLADKLGGAASEDLRAVIALTLGWIGQDAPEISRLVAAPGALGAALVVAAGEALRRRAAEAPLLIVLDDAHFADESTLGALEYAALDEAGAPIWICALGRPAFEEARPSWGDRAAERLRRRLDPLDAASAAELCRALLLPAEDVPDAVVRRIVSFAQAVPLFLIEIARALLREGIVRRPPGGGPYYVAADELERAADLPLVEWTALREIDALTPALRAHARLLSLLAAETAIDDIRGVLARLDRQGGAEEMTLDAGVGAQRLVSLGVLVSVGDARLRFRSSLVRGALARSVPSALRAKIHLAALEHYRSAEASVSEAQRLAYIAQHAAGAGDGAAAARAYLELASRSLAAHMYLDAELSYGRAIDLDLSPAALLEAHRGRGLMRYRLGRYDDALSDFGRAFDIAISLGESAQAIEILLDEATALDWMGEYARSAERSERARELAGHLEGDAGSPAIRARLLLSMGRSAHRAGRAREAAGLLREAADRAASLGDLGYETRVISLILLGFILQHLGADELGEAADALDSAIALCEDHGDRIHIGPAVAHRALLRGVRGDASGMRADYARALALGRELGQSALEVVGHYNLGEHLYLQGDLDDAEPHVRRALSADARREGGEPRSVVMLLDARLRLYRGDIEGARAAAKAIREREALSRARGDKEGLLAPAEDVLCAMLELATSGAPPAAWDDLVARSVSCSVGEEHIEVLEARALSALRASRVEEARRLFLDALAAASRIPNVMEGRLRRGLGEASGA